MVLMRENEGTHELRSLTPSLPILEEWWKVALEGCLEVSVVVGLVILRGGSSCTGLLVAEAVDAVMNLLVNVVVAEALVNEESRRAARLTCLSIQRKAGWEGANKVREMMMKG